MNSSTCFPFNSFLESEQEKLILEIIFPFRPHEDIFIKILRNVFTTGKD